MTTPLASRPVTKAPPAQRSPQSPRVKVKISAIVPVLNEQLNLPDCLESLDFVDEVFVVDSGSTDQTCPIAEAYGAKVVQFRRLPGGPRKKNWSLDHLPSSNEWVLIVDADERITPELRAEIEELFAKGPTQRGYYLNRLQYFMGAWLRHGGNFPSWNLRLLKRDAGRYEKLGTEQLETASAGDVEVHEHVLLDGPPGYLQEPMLHVDFKDLHHFIDRHNRYSTWDAKMRSSSIDPFADVQSIKPRLFGSPVERKRYLKQWLLKMPGKPLIWFLYTYVVRLGFLDGKAGFVYACLKMIQEFHINIKMAEMKQRQGKSA